MDATSAGVSILHGNTNRRLQLVVAPNRSDAWQLSDYDDIETAPANHASNLVRLNRLL